MPGTIAKLSWKLRWLLAGCVGLSAPFLLSRLLIQQMKLTSCECTPNLPLSIFDAIRSVDWFITLTLGPSPGTQAFIVLLLSLTAVVVLQRWRYKAAIKRLAATLGKTGIPTYHRVKYLLTCLNTSSTPIHQSATTELAILLPSLKSSDFQHFDSTARKSLQTLLNHLDNTVVIGALHALSNFGSKRDKRVVQRLLKREPLSTSDIHVRHAARECLQQIRARIDNQSDMRLLLRTAESDPATLMRTVN